MDADCYMIEYVIRDRLNDMRARARTAALLRQAGLPSPWERVGARLGGALGRMVRQAAAAIAHAVTGRAHTAKRSPLSLSTRRG